MTFGSIDTKREVVPRWRQFRSAAKKAELLSLKRAETIDIESELSEHRREASENPHDEWIIADYLSAALAAEARPAEVGAVATSLLELTDDPSLSVFARVVLDSLDETYALKPLAAASDPRTEAVKQVQNARKRLRDFPRDAITRVDLALAHTVLGNLEAARKEVSAAVLLAGDNRFVLRSAAAFFIEVDEPDAAHHILASSRASRMDPWIAAAALTSAELSDQKFDVRSVREMLQEGRYSDRTITELASELGTIEAKSGRTKPGKHHFKQSLLDPNENSLAQAAWAQEAMKVGVLLPSLAEPDANEARHRDYLQKGEWELALKEGLIWQADQPFSRFAGASTSYVASMGLERFDIALSVAKLALMTDPSEPTIANNAAFAAAQLGQTQEAQRLLSRVSAYMSDEESLVITATRGLIAFREDRIELGRENYQKAVAGFREAKMRVHIPIAVALWAMEEVRIRSPLMHELVRSARTVAEAASSQESKLLMGRLEDRYAEALVRP